VDTFGKIKVGNNVYVGQDSIILPGVTIEDNVIIGAGSVVTKSVPSGHIVAGNPARIVSTIEDYKKKSETLDFGTHGLSAQQKREILEGGEKAGLFIRKNYMGGRNNA